MNNITLPNFRDVNLYRLQYGIQLTPQQIISTFDDTIYENFISCWLLDCIDNKYERLDRKYDEIIHTGGAGDKGRDVIAIIDSSKNLWDNYQCKHYEASLKPTEIYCEVGKVLYYTYIKDYSIPQNYYFVAPKNIGPRLADYLSKPQILKNELLSNWDKYCKDDITSKKSIIIEGDFKDYVLDFDFSIFHGKGTDMILREFEKSKFYSAFFGGGFSKPRPLDHEPEKHILKNEEIYINQLIKAYGDAEYCDFGTVDNLKKTSENYYKHLQKQRVCFYKAESLKDYANESLPSEKMYEDFQQYIHDAIIDTVEDDYDNGYLRVKQTLKQVQNIDLSGDILGQVTRPDDRKGICHQLVNEEKMKWVDKNE